MNLTKNKVTSLLLTLMLIMAATIFVPESSATSNPILMDNGDGTVEWSECTNASTVGDAIERAFSEYNFDFSTGVSVNGITSSAIGSTNSNGSYTKPGSTGAKAEAKWQLYKYESEKWVTTSHDSPFDSAIAIGFYPEGYGPVVTPEYKNAWTMIRGDSQQTGQMTSDFSSSTGEAVVKWEDEGICYATPLYVGKYLFVKYGTAMNEIGSHASVKCIDYTTGKTIWTFKYPEIEYYETASCAIVGDKIFIPSATGFVFSFDWKTGPGELKDGKYSNEVKMTNVSDSKGWSIFDENVIENGNANMPSVTTDLEGTEYFAGNSSIIYHNGALLFSNTNGMTYCLNTNLELIWSHQSGGSIYFNSPTVSGNYVYVGSLDGHLYALNLIDGKEIDETLVYHYENHGDYYGLVSAVSVIKNESADTLIMPISSGQGMNTVTGGYAVYTFDGTSLSKIEINTDIGITSNFFTLSSSKEFKGVYGHTTKTGIFKIYENGSYEIVCDEVPNLKASPLLINGEYIYVSSFEPGKPIYQIDLDGKIVSSYVGPTSLYNYSMTPPIVIGNWIILVNDSGIAGVQGSFPAYVYADGETSNPWTGLLISLAGIVIILGAIYAFFRFVKGVEHPFATGWKSIKKYLGSDEISHNTRSRHRLLVTMIIGFSATTIMFLACICIGPTATLNPGEAISSLISAIQKGGQNLDYNELMVYSSRLPRTIIALAVGIGLSIAGVIYQAIIRNPLVDPYIMGVSSGAGTAAVAVIGFNFTFFGLLPANSIYLTAIAAMIGGLVAFAATMLLAEKAGGSSTNYVLAGVVVGLVFSAAQSLMLTMGSENISNSLSWLYGSFANVDWTEVAIVFFPVLAISLSSLLWAKEFNLILLGEDQAKQMGLDAVKFSRIMLILASILTSLCVAFVGIIGFVGLVIPHFCRMILGGDHRLVMPASIAFGGFLMLAADLASRMLLSGIELPVGAITTLIGVPVFGYLLISKGRMYDG